MEKAKVSCYQGSKKCIYLWTDKGFSNLLQKESKIVYTCGKGHFTVTRDQQELPKTCKVGEFKENKPLEIIRENKCLQNEPLMVESLNNTTTQNKGETANEQETKNEKEKN